MRKRMVSAIGVALLAVGCGSSEEYANDLRPPAAISIGISIKDDGVHLSPARVGAGPATLIVTNLTARSRDLLLRGDDGATRGCVDVDTTSGPINPRGTAKLQLVLREGSCRVGTRGGGTTPARLLVGGQRPTAQAELLQP